MLTVQRLQHASVPRPPGEEAHQRAVAFYEGVLGLETIPKPRTFTDIDVSWFKVSDQEIHVYASGPGEEPPHSGAHFCLVVDDLRAARAHLEQGGYRCDETSPIPYRLRFMTCDPFGNWIEICAIEGDYLAP